MSHATTQSIGQWAETLATDFLVQHRLKLVTRNYRCKMGEIDIILRDPDSLIFVEVRYRSSSHYGGALASITRFKQRRIIRTAQYFLLKNRAFRYLPCRFDVVTVSPIGTIDWIKDAFQVQ